MGVDDFRKREGEIYTQVPLLDGVEESSDGGISPEEARLRSESARAVLEFETEVPMWMDEYYKLRDAGWPWRVAVYIAWAASPKQARLPKTQDELATQVLGLASDRVIHTWRQKNPTIDEMVALLQAAPLMAHRRDIIQALISSAANPNYKNHPDRKLALEMMGDYQPRTEVDVRRKGTDDLSDYSDDELDRLASRMLNRQDENEGDEQ